MVERVPFQLLLEGDTADQHEFQGYDGYMAFAGFARTLSLATNYIETGEIRQRGDFVGRHAVLARAPSEGSVLVDFAVLLEQRPEVIFGAAAAGLTAPALLKGLVKRIMDRNVGDNALPQDPQIASIIERHSGDVEALVAISESPIRQTHGVIGQGANQIKVVGGHNIIRTLDQRTKDYVNLNYEDPVVRNNIVSVASFNVNSGFGSIYDFDLARTVPISMPRDVLKQYRSIFTWGLDQYASGGGGRVRIEYWRILAMDDTPKKYIISAAERIRE